MKPTRKTEPPLLLVFLWAMLDCFAIPLLVTASRQRQHYDEAPAVARETITAAARQIDNPHIIELGRGDPILDGQPVPWERLVVAISADKTDREILVRVRTGDDGQGPVSDLMRLSLIGREHRFADRLLFVNRQGKSNPAAEGDRS